MKVKTPIVFFGTPDFSVPSLKALHQSDQFDIKLVVSQPDRPSGRKLKLTSSPVKIWAEMNNLKVITPENCKSEEFISFFESLGVEGAVVVAFGQILNQKLLNLCPSKFINIHASLLPRWRGAAPIQRAIMEGDRVTGVSLQVMVKKLDAGCVISESKTEITPDENSIELHDRLSLLGAKLALKSVKKYFLSEIQPAAQQESLVTYAAKIEKNETWIRWSESSQQIWNHIRGLALGPGGSTSFKNKRLKVIKAKPMSVKNFEQIMDLALIFDSKKPGEILVSNSNGFYVFCGQDESSFSVLFVDQVQPESKPKMLACSYVNGSGLKEGNILGK